MAELHVAQSKGTSPDHRIAAASSHAASAAAGKDGIESRCAPSTIVGRRLAVEGGVDATP